MFRFKTKKKSLIYYALLFCLFSLLSLLIPAVRSPFLNILKNPLEILTLIKREVGGIIFYHSNLLQNEKLKKEIDSLRAKLIHLDELLLESKRLNNLLSLKEKSSYKVVAARVIGRSPDNWSSLIIINKGRYSGIRKGLVAVTHLGLIGRVIETTESTSKIMLMNDPNFAVSALVGRSRQEGLVSGTLGNSLIMRYLPRDCDIKLSDVIITSGLTQVYPKGLSIGRVVEIGEEFSGLSRYAIVKPTVDLSNLEEVLVITE